MCRIHIAVVADEQESKQSVILADLQEIYELYWGRKGQVLEVKEKWLYKADRKIRSRHVRRFHQEISHALPIERKGLSKQNIGLKGQKVWRMAKNQSFTRTKEKLLRKTVERDREAREKPHQRPILFLHFQNRRVKEGEPAWHSDLRWGSARQE